MATLRSGLLQHASRDFIGLSEEYGNDRATRMLRDELLCGRVYRGLDGVKRSLDVSRILYRLCDPSDAVYDEPDEHSSMHALLVRVFGVDLGVLSSIFYWGVNVMLDGAHDTDFYKGTCFDFTAQCPSLVSFAFLFFSDLVRECREHEGRVSARYRSVLVSVVSFLANVDSAFSSFVEYFGSDDVEWVGAGGGACVFSSSDGVLFFDEDGGRFRCRVREEVQQVDGVVRGLLLLFFCRCLTPK
jgi:hypothetical protein